MVKIILLLLASIFFLVVFSFAFYPNPIELITFFIIGLSILTLFVLVVKNLDKLTLNLPTKRRRYAKGIFYVIASFCFIFFITAFRVSWFEKEIILNIFKVQRGQAYFFILIFLLAIILIYCAFFYFKTKRLPSFDELDNELSLKGKKEKFPRVTINNVFLYIMVIVLAAIFWVVLFLTKLKD